MEIKIKYATTRTVFIFKKYVIKIPSIFLLKRIFSKNRSTGVYILWRNGLIHFKKGLEANRNEISVYKKYKPNFFAKIYFNFFNLIIIAKKIEGEKVKHELIFNQLMKKFIKKGEKFSQHDLHSKDWRKTKTGEIICLDYAGKIHLVLAKKQRQVNKILKNLS